MTLAEQISEWCDTRGRQAPLDDDFAAIDAEKLFRQMCEEFISEQLLAGFSPSTYVPKERLQARILDTSEFGARASIQGDDDVIEVNSGTLSFVLWLATKVVAVSEASSGKKKIRRRVATGRNASTLIDSFDFPDDPLLRCLSLRIAFCTFLFVFFHELGHLSQGHCRHLSTHSMLDFGAGTSDEIETPDARALEFMADLFAVRELFVYLESMRLHEESMDSHLTLYENLTSITLLDEMQRSTCAIYAISIAFHLTAQSQSGPHPNRNLRFLASLLCSKLYYSNLTTNHALNVVKTVDSAMLLSCVPEDSNIESLGEDFLREHGKDRVMREIHLLTAKFETLKNHLSVHARAPKAFLTVNQEQLQAALSDGGVDPHVPGDKV